MNLRTKLIRLAHQKPALRSALLPLLKQDNRKVVSMLTHAAVTAQGHKWLESLEKRYNVRAVSGVWAVVGISVETVPDLSEYADNPAMQAAIERREGMPLDKWLSRRRDQVTADVRIFEKVTAPALIQAIQKAYPGTKVFREDHPNPAVDTQSYNVTFKMPEVLLRHPRRASQDKQAFGLDRQWFTGLLTRFPESEHFPNYDGLDVEGFFILRGAGKPEGAAFYGKQNTPAFHYSFRDRADFLATLDKLAAGRRRDLAEKAKARALRKDYLHDYVVGDILYSSWGYDQTNVSFYEVTASKGKMVVVRAVAKKTTREEAAYGADYVVAIPGRFVGPPLKKMVGQGGYIRIDSSESAHKWNGKPQYETASGWGH